MASAARPASYADHSGTPPELVETSGAKTWLTRGANMVVAISDVVAGDRLERPSNADEYFVFLPNVGARIEAGGQAIDAAPESVTIVPPGSGPSRVIAAGTGRIMRVFSTAAADLAARAGNAAAYAAATSDVAPLKAWPDPAQGFRLRNYLLADYQKPGVTMRVFRSTNIMLSILQKRVVPRDTKTLSPHAHDDFEQASVLVQGHYLHHLRYPWTSDMSQWRDDETVDVGSPSVLIIPPHVIHTSRNIGPETSWLIDVFAPPRMDFSLKPGFVLNADDYPMPPAP
jgi:mannose-6-phosphate isomerase-like protein (cupin superfamily)